MDIRRLAFVNDACPLFQSGILPPYCATRWFAEALLGADDVSYHSNGFTSVVFRNSILTWTRSFSIDNKPVASLLASGSLIHLDEWVPGFGNDIDKHKYLSFGAPRKQAIAEIPVDGLLERSWSTNAKRHLKTFQNQTDVTIRLGTYAEIVEPYERSSVPANMRASMNSLVERHLLVHPSTIEVLVAESKTHGIVAGFVAGNCIQASLSFYLLGFYLPAARESQAMTGLVHAWFIRTQAYNLKYCNFGDICGPNPSLFQGERGYSIFKTHFGVRRVFYPGSRWKIRVR